jgi:beta-galactosidase/beta-glucuronidase
MWYTPVSGIWQTVWLESVTENYVTSLSVTTEENTATIRTEWSKAPAEGTVTVKTEDGDLAVPLADGVATVTVAAPRLWSPEDPFLYDFTVITPDDTVSSYFAFRTLSVETVGGYPRMCLNGKPYFFHGLLDQGYYSDGIFTPASPEGYERDIREMKALGFNTLRKHIKVEPQIFYHLCDRLGMVVFQDMVNNGDYSFLRDTALPTVGLLRKDDTRLHRDPETRAAFLTHMEETVAQLRHHQSICLWTIFNEGWGQFCGTEAYRKLKSLDDTRFIDTASGWFMGCESDLDSHHIYFRKVKLRAKDKPLYLSEFGGYVYKPEGHVFNTEKTYGYGSKKTREDFVSALVGLYRNEILPLIPKGLCATVYTQVSDVEDETNGLLSYDRKVKKVTAEEFKPLSDTLIQAIQK